MWGLSAHSFFLFQDLVKLEGGYVNVKCENRGGISAGESFICPQGKNKLYLKLSPFSCLSPGVQSAGNALMYIQPKVQHGIKIFPSFPKGNILHGHSSSAALTF